MRAARLLLLPLLCLPLCAQPRLSQLRSNSLSRGTARHGSYEKHRFVSFVRSGRSLTGYIAGQGQARVYFFHSDYDRPSYSTERAHDDFEEEYICRGTVERRRIRTDERRKQELLDVYDAVDKDHFMEDDQYHSPLPSHHHVTSDNDHTLVTVYWELALAKSHNCDVDQVCAPGRLQCARISWTWLQALLLAVIGIFVSCTTCLVVFMCVTARAPGEACEGADECCCIGLPSQHKHSLSVTEPT